MIFGHFCLDCIHIWFIDLALKRVIIIFQFLLWKDFLQSHLEVFIKNYFITIPHTMLNELPKN